MDAVDFEKSMRPREPEKLKELLTKIYKLYERYDPGVHSAEQSVLWPMMELMESYGFCKRVNYKYVLCDSDVN